MTRGWAPRRALGELAVLTLVVAGLLVPVLQLWRADPDVPMVAPSRYATDAPFYTMTVTGLIDHGTYLTNPDLNWPVGQELYDLPHGADNLQWLLLRAIGLVLGDPGPTVNAYYLLTYLLVAGAAFAALRALGVGPPAAGAAAVLYTFLPYHLFRSTANLLLSGYFMVPIACLIILRLGSDDPPLVSPDGRRLVLRDRRSLLVLAAAAGIASTGAYYAFFTVVFTAVVLAIDFLGRRRRAVLAAGAVFMGTIVVVSALNLAPSFVYWATHGPNDVAARRYPTETELFGLKVSALVLPSVGHRVDALSELGEGGASRLPGEAGQALGIVGALGFVGLVVLTLVRAVHPRRRARAPDPPTLARLPLLGALSVAGVLLATVSGFSLLLAGLGLTEFRSWNRIVVFLAFFALTAVAIVLDRFLDHLPRGRLRPLLTGAIAAGVVLVGLLDQTGPGMLPDYTAQRARWDSDARFVAAIDRALPAGAGVYQLPYVPFPEWENVGGVGLYDEALDYVHARDLGFSYGAMRGRQDAWQVRLAESRDLLPRLVAVGYSGLVIDRRASGGDVPLLEIAIAGEVGVEPILSPNGEKAFYDLRPYGEEVRAELGARRLAELRRDTLDGAAA